MEGHVHQGLDRDQDLGNEIVEDPGAENTSAETENGTEVGPGEINLHQPMSGGMIDGEATSITLIYF